MMLLVGLVGRILQFCKSLSQCTVNHLSHTVGMSERQNSCYIVKASGGQNIILELKLTLARSVNCSSSLT